MDTTGQTVSRAELAAFAMELGVTDEQLHRWRNRGLLPEPIIQGLGRGKGTQARYPISVLRHVVALLDVLGEKRDIDAACWRLWWNGYNIAPTGVRGSLTAATGHALRRRRRAAARRASPRMAARFEAEQRQRLKDRSPLSRIRARVGKNRFVVFRQLLDEIVSGLASGIEIKDAALLVEALGLPMTPEQAVDIVRAISTTADPARFTSALAATTDRQLTKARDDARNALRLVESFAHTNPNAPIPGFSAAAVSILAAYVLDDLPREIFLAWLVLRQEAAFGLLFPLALNALRAPPAELSP